MKCACALLAAVLMACEKPVPPKPVVHVPIVETHPFDEGYRAGFEFGKAASAPRSPMPSTAEVAVVAGVEASGDPGRNEKWRRGFIEGYTDGFRKISTGQK